MFTTPNRATPGAGSGRRSLAPSSAPRPSGGYGNAQGAGAASSGTFLGGSPRASVSRGVTPSRASPAPSASGQTPSRRRAPLRAYNAASRQTPARGTPGLEGSPAAAVQRTRLQPRSFDTEGAEDTTGDGDDSLSMQAVALQEGTILARDDLSAVTVFSNVPDDVRQLLDAADPYADPIDGGFDVSTGFAFVVSRSRCLVWAFSDRGPMTPASYAFSIPSAPAGTPSAPSSLPFVGLVSKASGREPGLLLATPAGEIHFWDNVGAAMSGEERRQTLSIVLGSGESIVGLKKCQTSSYALATSASRRFLVSIYPQGGRLVPILSPFAQPRGLIGRLFGSGAGSLTLGGSGEERTVLSSVPSLKDAATGAWDTWIITQRNAQKWSIVERGGERLVLEQDLRPLILSAAFGENASAMSPDSVGLEIVDAAALSDGTAVVLYSHLPKANGPRSFGLANVALGTGSFVVRRCSALKFTAHRDPRRNATPRLRVPHGGPAAFVAFPHAVVMALLDEELEEVILLADSVRNRIIGVGSEPTETSAASSVSALSCLTSRGPALLVEFSCVEAAKLAAVQRDPAERTTTATMRLKAKLEQAVFYGDDARNPVSFALPPNEIDGELMTAAESLSYDIVTSSCSALPELVDLRQQLALRGQRLLGLIGCVNANGLLGRLSTASRRHLCADAELVAAAHDLWLYYNDFVGASHRTGRLADPLGDAIEAVMTDLGERDVEDSIRAFFRQHLDRVGLLLSKLLARLGGATSQPLEVRTRKVFELNRIVLALFQGARNLRKDKASVYDFESGKLTFEAWSSTPGSIELLESLFHATQTLIADRTRALGSVIDVAPGEMRGEGAVAGESEQSLQQWTQQELKSHLCDLASQALAAYEERIAYLTATAGLSTTTAAHAETAAQRELSVVRGRFHSARPQMIHPIASVGRTERAFALAEQHRDFRTLTELCNSSALAAAPAKSRIQHYLQRYRQAFAFELYQWYIEQGQAKTLLTQDEVYGDLVLEFLESTDNARIKWVHDLALDRFAEASETLLGEASQEELLGPKKLMLSLGKLAYVAELSEDRLAVQSEQQRIELIDDQLDLVNVHARLVEAFEEVAPGIDASQIEELAPLHLTRQLEDRPTLQGLFGVLARRLMQGSVLSSEELIDLLTLKDTPRKRDLADLYTSLEVFARTRDLPQARASAALTTIWIRTILKDDWIAITDTTGASDDEMTMRLRGTALFFVLRRAYQSDSTSSAILEPTACLERPTKDLIAGRYPSMPEQQVSLLLDEMGAQVDELQDLVEGQTKLGTWYEECARLARIAAEQEEDGDEEEDGEGDEEMDGEGELVEGDEEMGA